MSNFTEMVKKMSPKGWVMLGGSLVLGVAFLMIVMSVASKPSYSTSSKPTSAGPAGSRSEIPCAKTGSRA